MVIRKFAAADEGKSVKTSEIIDKKIINPGGLPCKVFEARNSPLTDLWEVKHIRTIYHICIAVLVGLFINTAACDFLKDGKSHLGLNLIIKGFTRFHVFIFIWTCMFLTSIGVYFGFKFWATIRVQLTSKPMETEIWDRFFLVLFILFYPTFMFFSTVAVTYYDLSILLSLATVMEMTRFLMKMHAFVRSNAPRVLKYKSHINDQTLYPELSKFLYFSFAPTVVYQDNYPRTKEIRWNYVRSCALEFIGTLFFMSFIVERYFLPSFEHFGKQPLPWRDVVVMILEHGVPGMLLILSIFYLVLHAWFNMFAEMLRFSDRMFYKDWWVSPNYERYYRTWNVVVHDWLYTYIYKDFYEIVLPKNKLAAKYMVFFVSAFFHDYILAFGFRFYIPILFLQFFGAGTIMTYLKIKEESIGNVLLWYTLTCGNGINFSFYFMEYYSRVNCPIKDVTVSSYFIPRMFTCNTW